MGTDTTRPGVHLARDADDALRRKYVTERAAEKLAEAAVGNKKPVAGAITLPTPADKKM